MKLIATLLLTVLIASHVVPPQKTNISSVKKQVVQKEVVETVSKPSPAPVEQKPVVTTTPQVETPQAAPTLPSGSHDDWLLAAGVQPNELGYANYIIANENGNWCPTRSYGQKGCPASGNVNVAYGIPQANPGTKMASAGADWMTNPITQLRWMNGYVHGSRFDAYGGGWLGAYNYKVQHGTY